VALAAGLEGSNGPALRATVLVVVVLTVIIFGGTTARMLEIYQIRTGVVEEIDSDDEFDIETANGGTYYKRTGTGVGHTPRRGDPTIALDRVESRANGRARQGLYSSGNNRQSPPRGDSRLAARKNSTLSLLEQEAATQNLLSRGSSTPSEDEDAFSDGDLPPAARRSPRRKPSPRPAEDGDEGPLSSYVPPDAGEPALGETHANASGRIREIFSRSAGEHAAWFRQLDEDYIKPTLLLDQSKGGGS